MKTTLRNILIFAGILLFLPDMVLHRNCCLHSCFGSFFDYGTPACGSFLQDKNKKLAFPSTHWCISNPIDNMGNNCAILLYIHSIGNEPDKSSYQVSIAAELSRLLKAY